MLRFCLSCLVAGPALFAAVYAQAQSDTFATIGADNTPGPSVAPIAPPQAAPAPLLPPTGSTLGSAALRDQSSAGQAAPPLERAARNWTLTPSLGLAEEYNSNVAANTGLHRGDDFVSLIQPGLNASGTTTRLQGSLNYNPTVDIYARALDETQLYQNFSGNVRAALVPETLFLDGRGFGFVTTNGLAGSAGTDSAINRNQTQSESFSLSPYALHRFDTWGTGELGAAVAHTSTRSLDGGAAIDPYGGSGDQTLTTYSGHAGVTTGEAFGRYNAAALAYGSQYDGTGVLSNAARDSATLDNGYAITRSFTALAELGYEHIRYTGSHPLRIDDAIWNIGFRITLGPDSSIEARYGHHDGFDAFSLDGALQPTPHTRLYLRYSEGLDTDAEQLQNALATSDIDALGNPIDHTTGAPLLLNDGFFGFQNNLYRSRRASATATLIEARDIVSLSVEYEDNTLISSSGLPGTLGSNRGVYGNSNWSHDLSPTLKLSVAAQYGVRAASGENQRVVSASIALTRQLSETLSAQLRTSYNRISGGQANLDQTLVLLSAVKSF